MIRLTINAAEFFIRNNIALRNSNTKQLISRHLQEGTFPETHGIGVDYAIPLWTIGILDMEEPNKSGDNKKLKEQIRAQEGIMDEQLREDRRAEQQSKPSPIYQPMVALRQASPGELDSHLKLFAEKIKEHFNNFSPFGKFSREGYCFEVILGRGGTHIDDIGRYSTGGRCDGNFGKNSLVYRATLSDSDVYIMQRILRGEFDETIQQHIFAELKSLNHSVVVTLRLALCEELCKDILLHKIIKWANAMGECDPAQKKEISLHILTKKDLGCLLLSSCKNIEQLLQNISSNGWVSIHVDRNDEYIRGEKWTDIQTERQAQVSMWKKIVKFVRKAWIWVKGLFNMSSSSLKRSVNPRLADRPSGKTSKEILDHDLAARVVQRWRKYKAEGKEGRPRVP